MVMSYYASKFIQVLVAADRGSKQWLRTNPPKSRGSRPLTLPAAVLSDLCTSFTLRIRKPLRTESNLKALR